MATIDLSGLMPQQREVATTLDRPLFVSAGAGSGKTFTLTQRVLWALSEGSGPGGAGSYIEHVDQALIITFTDAAAAEIRERVRAALLAAGMAEEAFAIDDAWISTIHSMCARILRAHALELGLDPEFSVLSEFDADELMDLAVDHVLARAQAGVDEQGRAQRSYRKLFSWYAPMGDTGTDGKEAGTTVRKLVRKLLELASAAPHGLDDIHIRQGKIDFHALEDAYRSWLDGTQNARDKAKRALDAIEDFLASPRTRGDLAACMMVIYQDRSNHCFPSKGGGHTQDEVVLLKAEVADAFANAYLAVDAAALDELMALARDVAAEYEQLKAARSGLDNNDLLRLAYRALRDQPQIRAEYADRFKLVMIDEFQDTDQQQVDLIRFLTGADGRTLCTVGDAQQSIYRFRGAEVEVFRRQQRALEGAVGAVADSDAAAGASAPAGRLVELTRNFRSHAEILEYVRRIFDGAQGGLMPGFLDLEPHEGRRDALVAAGAARRQAVFVAGGAKEARTQAKAAAIAERFRVLADAGQPAGDMVLLLGVMTNADVYAEAIRARGLACVIAGGSVFAQAPEVRAVRALACALANPADTAQGLAPLLQSPMFALGAQEFLALATAYDTQTGETRRRNLDAGLFSDDDAPGLEGLPLVARARAVLRCALGRVGRDPFAAIARDVVNESGWMARLAARGPEGRAVAANVLKVLDAIATSEAQVGNAPRQIVGALDAFLVGKEAPGALNEGAGGAVRIMTVHASKGLEFPVVAVAECFAIRNETELMQVERKPKGQVEVSLLPARFSSARSSNGTVVGGGAIKKFVREQCAKAWISPELADNVCASDSALGGWLAACEANRRLELEEKARLLYVACTRAREVLILALDPMATGADIKFNEDYDLAGVVLRQILPQAADGSGAPELDANRLVFGSSRSGDYEFIALGSCAYGAAAFEVNAELVDGTLVRLADADTGVDALGAAGGGGPAQGVEACRESGAAYRTCACGVGAVEDGAPTKESLGSATGMGLESAAGPAGLALEGFTLAYPAPAAYRVAPAPPAARDSYSYSSMAKALHAEGEDRAPAAERAREEDDVEGGVQIARTSNGDPTALGSAFHAAAQWMVETGADTVPTARLDALARTWNCTPEQRVRLDGALARWCGSAVRREALEWPKVRAEVPFFSLGASAYAERFGVYAEGSIDLLCTDPARPGEALVIDYKTGGSPAETAEQLQRKHALQAEVYADALHKAGFERVSLRFVRVEIEDPQAPGEPQVVSYEL